MARFVGYERLVVQPDQVFGGEGLRTQFVTEVLDGVLAFECQLIGERQMHKRRFVIGITAFHLADKTLDDVRFLKFELQGTEYRVFQQIIERSLPVAGKEMTCHNPKSLLPFLQLLIILRLPMDKDNSKSS